MARALRLEVADAIYHLSARGNERRPAFRGDGDRERFLGLLARSCERYEVSLLGFVVMGNHFHLVGQTHQWEPEPVDAPVDGHLFELVQLAAPAQRASFSRPL